MNCYVTVDPFGSASESKESTSIIETTIPTALATDAVMTYQETSAVASKTVADKDTTTVDSTTALGAVTSVNPGPAPRTTAFEDGTTTADIKGTTALEDGISTVDKEGTTTMRTTTAGSAIPSTDVIASSPTTATTMTTTTSVMTTAAGDDATVYVKATLNDSGERSGESSFEKSKETSAETPRPSPQPATETEQRLTTERELTTSRSGISSTISVSHLLRVVYQSVIFINRIAIREIL